MGVIARLHRLALVSIAAVALEHGESVPVTSLVDSIRSIFGQSSEEPPTVVQPLTIGLPPTAVQQLGATHPPTVVTAEPLAIMQPAGAAQPSANVQQQTAHNPPANVPAIVQPQVDAQPPAAAQPPSAPQPPAAAQLPAGGALAHTAVASATAVTRSSAAATQQETPALVLDVLAAADAASPPAPTATAAPTSVNASAPPAAAPPWAPPAIASPASVNTSAAAPHVLAARAAQATVIASLPHTVAAAVASVNASAANNASEKVSIPEMGVEELPMADIVLGETSDAQPTEVAGVAADTTPAMTPVSVAATTVATASLSAVTDGAPIAVTPAAPTVSSVAIASTPTSTIATPAVVASSQARTTSAPVSVTQAAATVPDVASAVMLSSVATTVIAMRQSTTTISPPVDITLAAATTSNRVRALVAESQSTTMPLWGLDTAAFAATTPANFGSTVLVATTVAPDATGGPSSSAPGFKSSTASSSHQTTVGSSVAMSDHDRAMAADMESLRAQVTSLENKLAVAVGVPKVPASGTRGPQVVQPVQPRAALRGAADSAMIHAATNEQPPQPPGTVSESNGTSIIVVPPHHSDVGASLVATAAMATPRTLDVPVKNNEWAASVDPTWQAAAENRYHHELSPSHLVALAFGSASKATPEDQYAFTPPTREAQAPAQAEEGAIPAMRAAAEEDAAAAPTSSSLLCWGWVQYIATSLFSSSTPVPNRPAITVTLPRRGFVAMPASRGGLFGDELAIARQDLRRTARATRADGLHIISVTEPWARMERDDVARVDTVRGEDQAARVTAARREERRAPTKAEVEAKKKTHIGGFWMRLEEEDGEITAALDSPGDGASDAYMRIAAQQDARLSQADAALAAESVEPLSSRQLRRGDRSYLAKAMHEP